MKERIINYVIVGIITSLITIFVLHVQDIYHNETARELNIKLTNGFFVGGGLMFSFGVLAYVSSEGVFDGISFAFKTLFDRIIRRDYIRYGDYKQQKGEKKRPKTISAMVLGGLVFILISFIYMALSYQ